jgi:predicted RNA-binding protein with RPS1 domain
MFYIRDIMELLQVNQEVATKVFAWMDLDLSECTQEDFNADARYVYDQIKNGTYK